MLTKRKKLKKFIFEYNFECDIEFCLDYIPSLGKNNNEKAFDLLFRSIIISSEDSIEFLQFI